VEKLANVLVLVLLFEMMISVGLGISIRDLVVAFTGVSLLLRAAVANYILVPLIAAFLLYLYQVPAIVAVGFLLIAVCPAAPFAPSLTAMAKENVAVSAGLMLALAASSAFSESPSWFCYACAQAGLSDANRLVFEKQ
jgi:bile acid:Na+ symporter, BASS family